MPEPGARALSNENITSSALNGLPSWNLTPLRSWNVQTLPPLLGFHEVAREGSTFQLSSVVVSRS